MPTRGRTPRFLVLFILAFAFVGIAGFQILKERRNANAAFSEKDFQLQNTEKDLKEQVKVTHEREEERDFAQSKLLELERISQSALDSLHAKERELENVMKQHQETVEEVVQLKKVVEQKEGEIVHVRGQLQEYSFAKAKESAEQIISEKVEPELENRQAEEHKPADEAGLGDRKRIEEEEEVVKDTDVSAIEREMDERSKPDGSKLAEIHTSFGDAKKHEALKREVLHEEEADEQDNADTRDPDKKESDASQEVDLNEVTKLEADMQTGDHEEAGIQQADHDTE